MKISLHLAEIANGRERQQRKSTKPCVQPISSIKNETNANHAMSIFHLFPKLPTEIRNRIWCLAAHPHTIFIFNVPNEDGLAHGRAQELLDQGRSRFEEEVLTAIHLANDECNIQYCFKILPVMQTCRETYYLFQSLFDEMRPLGPAILPWISFDQDVLAGEPDILRPLYLQHPWCAMAIQQIALLQLYYPDRLFNEEWESGKPMIEFGLIGSRFPSLKTVTLDVADDRKLVVGQYPYHWHREWLEPMRKLYHPQQPYDRRQPVEYTARIINKYQSEDEWITRENYLRQWHKWELKQVEMYNLLVPEEARSPEAPFDSASFYDVIKLDDDDLDRPDIWWKKHGPFEHL